MTDVREALMLGRNSDGKLVNRPLSPHLQVHKPILSMMMSISHRITGVALAVGLLLMAWWVIAAATSPDAFDLVQWVLGSWIGILALLGWTFALWYHFFYGLRHLAWDYGWGWEKSEIAVSGWLVLLASGACTAVVFVLGLVLRG